MLSVGNLFEYCRTCLVKIGDTNAEANYKSVSIKRFPDMRHLIDVCISKSTVVEDSLYNYAPFICQSCFDKWSEFSKIYHIAIKADEKIRNLLKNEISKTTDVVEVAVNDIPGEKKNENLLNTENSDDDRNVERYETCSPCFTNNQLTNMNLNDMHIVNSRDIPTDLNNQLNSLKSVPQIGEDSNRSFSAQIYDPYTPNELKQRNRKIKNMEKANVSRKSIALKNCYKKRIVQLKPSDQRLLPNKENQIISDFDDNGTKKLRYQCKECNKYFWERNKYDGHMKQAHEGIRRPYKCHQCEKSYNLYKTLLQHKRECHSEKTQEVFQCEQCEKTFKSGVILKQHLNNKHSERKESVRSICDQCGFIAAHQYSLTRHITNRHTETDQIKCGQCPKVFKTRYSLKYHVIGKHMSNMKPFKCSECQMEFARKTLLNQHERTHLKYTERMKCDFEGCNVRFVKRGDKTHHMRLVHLKIKQHICDFCGEAFGAMQTLRHHRFIHTGEKPYKCNVCGQGFRQRTAMKTHRKIHFGNNPADHDSINNLPETNLCLLNNVII